MSLSQSLNKYANMNIVVLYGSPHENGKTAALLAEFLCEASRQGIDTGNIITFDAYTINAKPCIDCGQCAANAGLCCLDDLDEVITLLKNADLLILATPIYNFSFPAPLKAIIDRLQCVYEKESLKKEEHAAAGVLLCSCGSSGKLDFELILSQSKLVFKILEKQYLSSVLYANTDTDGEKPPVEAIQKAVMNILNHFESKNII